MKPVTIVIPFLNEGDEPVHTIESVYNTVDSDLFNIVLAHDDPSDPPFEIPHKDNVILVKNPKRLGVGPTRNLGINASTGKYVLIIDAHMRFQDNWFNRLLEEVSKASNIVVSSLSKSVHDGVIDNKSTNGYGCNLLMKNDFSKDIKLDNTILTPKWRRQEKDKGACYNVPCIMGACYMASKEWLEHIKKFDGLQYWGSSEPFICLKTYLAGGECKVVTDAVSGHIYRSGAAKLPYVLYNWQKMYNKMVMIYTLFPDHLVRPAIEEIEKVKMVGDYNAAEKFVKENFAQLMNDRAYYKQIFCHDLDWYCNHFGIDRFWK